MNLPHLPPIRFAKDVLFRGENRAKVLCEFPFIPTLPMLVEAAAQSTSAFSNTDTPKNGFLVLIKDVTLHAKAQSLICVVTIELKLSLGHSSEFFFEVFEKEGDVMCASGSVMLVLEEA